MTPIRRVNIIVLPSPRVYQGWEQCSGYAPVGVKIKGRGKIILRYLNDRLASAEEPKEVTGFLPGGVCPFGLEGAPVAILLDVSLDEYDTIYPAAGTDATDVFLSPEYLHQITGGVKVEVT